ncbi:MAG: general secretion pathway protein GspK [Verrucomicrobia bacterium]|nr:general secretion pathway protein GspK [Verrucomicrobiota bacterium]
MVTLLFATFALLAFMEKASVDLLVDQRESVTRRLRLEAYSALEVTLGVLVDFREAFNGLRSPAEGWNDPLAFAGYTPADGRTVEITFEDESSKLPLPHVSAQTLTALFLQWGVAKAEAEAIADVLLGWIKRGHVYTSPLQPNYESGALPYETPGRSLKSYHELAAIDKAREFFYDADGRPNDNWRRFVECVSLFDFPKPNLNGARPDVLAALGQFDQTQTRSVTDYLRGTGNYQFNGPGFFQNPNDVARVAGAAGDTGGFGTTISALRINLTVREGRNEYRISTVVAPPGGASTVQEVATKRETITRGSSKASTPPGQPAPGQASPRPNPSTTAKDAVDRNLKYPFTLLEIRENDEISSMPGGS